VSSGFLLAVLAVAMTARPRDLVTIGSAMTGALLVAGYLTSFGPPGYTPILLAITACAASACCAQQSVLVTQRRRLRELSRRDALTGCLNRHGVTEWIYGFWGRPAPGEVALITFDLDGFKKVNDTFGHAAGDDLLRWVGATISSLVRDGDPVSRVGGDEFSVFVEGPFAEPPSVLATRIGGALRARTEVSIGCAVYPDEAEDVQALAWLADERMYAAKRAAAASAG
jgi:diguanylate cyclase (GGDEF)-like protein